MRRYAVLAMFAAVIALSGCAQQPPAPQSTQELDVAATPKPVEQTPTPVRADAITVGLDGFTTVYDGETATFTFDDPEPLLAFVEEVTGVPRQGEDFDDPWGNGDVWGTKYTWDDIIVSVLLDGPAGITVLSPTIGDVAVKTASGIAVGATRDEAAAAGAWDGWDADGDGVPDSLGIDDRMVEDTQSLTRPGDVGRQYVALTLENDVVTKVSSPSNDYSDL